MSASEAAAPPLILVIGAGFSGTAVAVHLLARAAGPLRVVMVNRSGEMARGLAYGTASPQHLLNVPAGRMSLFPDRPGDFLTFLQAQPGGWQGGDFVPRSLYGDYLHHRLQSAAAARPGVLVQRVGMVRSLVRGGDGRLVARLDDGSAMVADRVVLSVGNHPPMTPAALRAVAGHPGYVADPWRSGALDPIDQKAPVLLLGSGLTMLDVALELARRGHQGPLMALSRRGLLPQAHRDSHHPHDIPLPPELFAQTGLGPRLRLLRRWIAALAATGIDWRDALVALRPVTPRLWQTLTTGDRRRFLHHLQPYWDTHRHRCAPAIAQAVGDLRDQGRLQVIAGRLQGASPTPGGIAVSFIRRGSGIAETLTVGTLINCTGPAGQVQAIPDPLLHTLLAAGDIQTDALGLGLVTLADYRLAGPLADRLYHVGPFLKGQFWEATAVPELREHAAALVTALLQSL
ncbi:MAG: FAD/NAD(P)-binding protein [Zoogloeaceae bacterium]|nr:FAD/NAD(P)-binding protein [Zoogloeaceae bacterium]